MSFQILFKIITNVILLSLLSLFLYNQTLYSEFFRIFSNNLFIKFDFTFTLYSLQSKLGFLRPNISTNLRAFRGFPDRVCDEIATGNRTLFWTVLARRSPIACIYIDSKIYRISTDKREYRKFRCDEIVSVSSSSELGTCSKNTCTS